ncbi:hypothetical protein, partial [Erythrobacter sp. YJ-T3-07]|uniref:hypothetical protein n=1 Tax=Erythrobacter sp. YJ-T3-07 TaxID=2793063 RepID=UPI001F1ADEB9
PANQIPVNHSSYNGSNSSTGSLQNVAPYTNHPGYGGIGNTSAQSSPLGITSAMTLCDCNSVKAIMRDVFFKNAVNDQDVWVVPNAAALQLHHHFGGGTPVPRGDLVLTADKVEMLRNLLF